VVEVKKGKGGNGLGGVKGGWGKRKRGKVLNKKRREMCKRERRGNRVWALL
jgi:hypothetical protein